MSGIARQCHSASGQKRLPEDKEDMRSCRQVRRLIRGLTGCRLSSVRVLKTAIARFRAQGIEQSGLLIGEQGRGAFKLCFRQRLGQKQQSRGCAPLALSDRNYLHAVRAEMYSMKLGRRESECRCKLKLIRVRVKTEDWVHTFANHWYQIVKNAYWLIERSSI